MTNETFWLCVFTFVLGLVLSIGVAWLCRRLIGWYYPNKYDPEYLDYLIRKIVEDDKYSHREALLAAVQDRSDYRERRNEFWTSFGQIILSIFIVTVLTVMLISKTIEPDAGLPILSGISGFTIAKTISTSKNQPHRGPNG